MSLIMLVSAQHGMVTGIIKNSLEPLANATVNAGVVSVITDDEGSYTLVLASGNHVITYSHAGYISAKDTIILKPGEHLAINRQLRPANMLSEVEVVGSRSLKQYDFKPVPVDIIPDRHLVRTGQISLTQMLQHLSPSFNTSRELLFESSTLRGLDPQHVVILVNGMRYHNSASINGGGLRGQLGRGSAGNDLNSIPFPAIHQVEILKDGATAQYGSDAISGVINIKLKNAPNAGSISLQLGQYYAGDGERLSFGFNRGTSLNKKGFLNYSGSIRVQGSTYRGGTYTGTFFENVPENVSSMDREKIMTKEDSILGLKGIDRASIADNAGNVKLFSFGTLLHGGYQMSSRSEVFFIASVNARQTERNAFYRFPKDTRSVNTLLYPDGFQPLTNQLSTDVSVYGGIKWRTDNKLLVNLNTGYGSNFFTTGVDRSNNASQQNYLGQSAPTSFYTGKDLYSLFTNALHFSKLLVQNRLWKSINISWGAEWRMEKYQRKAGEKASWENYDATGKKAGGSQGSTGIHPDNELDKSRHILSIYADGEIEFTSKLMIDAAVRYEDYSDYGSNFAGKLSGRYEFAPCLALRASFNNGFRAPTLQQRYLNTIQNQVITTGGVLVPAVGGIFPNDNPIVRAFGVPALKPETSTNVSAGIIAKISTHVNVSLDVYSINIRDRIILTGALHKDVPGVKPILDNIPNLRVNQIQFYTNAIDTRTGGADIFIKTTWSLGKDQLSVTLGSNLSDTRVVGDVKGTHKLPTSTKLNTLFNDEERTKLEDSQPGDKFILSATYRLNKLKFNIRSTRFGKTMIRPYYPLPINLFYPQQFSAKLITDCNISFTVTGGAVISIGANNLFNVFPDRIKDEINTSLGRWMYSPEASPFGFNGGHYFASVQFRWD